MKRLYIRWSALVVLFGAIGLLGFARYNRDVRTISPKQLLDSPPSASVRILGMVAPGSLERGREGVLTRFELSGEKGANIFVQFAEEDEETLRELKTVVVVGKWDSARNVLNAGKVALVPNYGFITSAYLLSLIPLGFFLFHMERKVAMLYIMIKEEKVYEPEASA